MSTQRSPVARVLSGVLLFQIALAALLVLGDSRTGSGIGFPDLDPSAPRLDAPVNPGDQRRRFRPSQTSPIREPGRGAPDMPSRLALTQIDGPLYRLEGTIRNRDAPRIIAQLAEIAPPPERIVLHSPGGSVADALVLGRYLRRSGIATEILGGEFCYSSCPYLLAGGTTRTVDEDASVGVHQHYFGQSTVLPAAFAVEDIQHGQGEVMAYLIEMGIDPAMMQYALTTPPDEIYILLPEQMDDYGLSLPAEEAG